MPDIRERFGIFDRLEVPDLWSEAERRRASVPGATPRRARGRIAAAAVAVAVSLPAGILVWQAFRPNDPTPGGTQAAQTAILACTSSGTEVLTPRVQAMRDGVHVEVSYPAEGRWQVVFEGSPGPLGTSPQIFHDVRRGAEIDRDSIPIAPGSARVACFEVDPNHTHRIPADAWVPIAVVDPDAVFRPYNLSCDSDAQVELHLGPSGPIREDLTPEELVRTSLSGLSSQDVIERAGYANAETTWGWIRVVRGSSTVVAAAQVRLSSPIVVEAAACAESGIREA
jgi:hypothetical protein